MQTLPDYLRPGLDIVVIGLNPSPTSVSRGFYYGHPRNRFWPALRAAGLMPADLEPGPELPRILCAEHGIGFTDIVKMPTPGAADLRASDYRSGAPRLHEKLVRYRPLVAWFNGKGVYEHYLRHATDIRGSIALGLQPDTVTGATVAFVTPNPSPANAAFSLDDLVSWYRQVALLRDRLKSQECTRPRPR